MEGGREGGILEHLSALATVKVNVVIHRAKFRKVTKIRN